MNLELLLTNHGIDTKKLSIGTKLVVYTKNNVYFLEMLDSEKGKCMVHGGLHIPEPIPIHYSGASYRKGGPIKVGWIVPFVGMEFCLSRKCVLNTTPVTRVKVIGDGWEYMMNWETKDS